MVRFWLPRAGGPAVTPPASRGPGVAPASFVAVLTSDRGLEAIGLSSGLPSVLRGVAWRCGSMAVTERSNSANDMPTTALTAEFLRTTSSEHGAVEQRVAADELAQAFTAAISQLNAVFCRRSGSPVGRRGGAAAVAAVAAARLTGEGAVNG